MLLHLNEETSQLMSYFTKIRVMWDELNNFRPDSVCVCTTKYSYVVLSTIVQHKQEGWVMEFLRGLNDQYNNVRSYVLLMDPISPISKFFSYY